MKIGDKVRIISKDWYDAQPKTYNGVCVGSRFTFGMSAYCGLEATITYIDKDCDFLLDIDNNQWWWQEWMFDKDYEYYKQYTTSIFKSVKVSLNYRFANLSKEWYRHFPILWFACGKDGFIICIFGFNITVKW